MKNILISELLVEAGKYAITLQQLDGSFPSGHNGPYHDPETPVRNTAHFLYLLSVLYKRTGEQKFKNAAENSINYLASPASRPNGKTFYHRNKKDKDRCNGLVGQAWCIEALVMASQVFDRPDCYALAEEVFLLHPWDDHVGIWRRVEVDGTVLGYDGTFNHQLWFAAAAGLLVQTPQALERAKKFLNSVASRVKTYPDGVIFHSSAMGSLISYLWNGPKAFLSEVRSRIRKNKKVNDLYSKSVGYHGFNLYALAMLKQVFDSDDFWHSKKFECLLKACENDSFNNALYNSEYGYMYNVSGIEIAYAFEVFKNDEVTSQKWLQKQFDECLLNISEPLVRGASDHSTALARVYEIARLTSGYSVSMP